MRLLVPLLLAGCAQVWFDGRTWNCDALGAGDGLVVTAPGGLRLDDVADSQPGCRLYAAGPAFPTPIDGGLDQVSEVRVVGASEITAAWGSQGRQDLGETVISFALDYDDQPRTVVRIVAPPSGSGTAVWNERDREDLELFVTCDRCDVAAFGIHHVTLDLDQSASARICASDDIVETGSGYVARLAGTYYQTNPCL